MRWRWGLLAALVLLVTAGGVNATMFLETFDDYIVGDLHGQGGWSRTQSNTEISVFSYGGGGGNYVGGKCPTSAPYNVVIYTKTYTPAIQDSTVIIHAFVTPSALDGNNQMYWGSSTIGGNIGFAIEDYRPNAAIFKIVDGVKSQLGATVPYDSSEWTEVEITYDTVNNIFKYINFTNPDISYSDQSGSSTNWADTPFDKVWIKCGDTWLGGNSYFDDFYIMDTTLPTYIVIRDSKDNLITGAQVAIYDDSNDGWVQKYETCTDGIISISKSVGTNLKFMVRTFDGVFVSHFTIDSEYNTINITIPLNYNLKVYPEDQNGVPLTGVFAGLAEYTPLDPQAFWGFSMSGSQYVPVTNCSGFSMCDIIAEKEGYADYKVEALNWTSKSALVKDYRHNVVMEEE